MITKMGFKNTVLVCKSVAYKRTVLHRKQLYVSTVHPDLQVCTMFNCYRC